MGTSSVLAIQDGDGDEWRGRYCHWDGYPTHMGKVLWSEIRQAGYDAFEFFLVEGRGTHGVSDLDHGFLTAPVEQTWEHGSVQGNLRVYRDRPGEDDATPMWVTASPRDWVYVATPDSLAVLKGAKCWVCPFDEPEPDWAKIEEGQP